MKAEGSTLMKNINILQGIVLLSIFASPDLLFAASAFPGAEGFGAGTRGAYELYEQTGRLSDLPAIIHVTNLNDSGAGSFRAALEASAPRIVVFDIGGVINLSSPIILNNSSYLTVAGQTAPGDGICIRGENIEFRSGHDLIIRSIRIRDTNDDALGFRPVNGDGVDRSYNIVVDHCSLSWNSDEVLSNYGKADHFTFSNNILDSPYLEHNFGSMIGPGSKYFTVTKNVILNADYRTPLYGGGGDTFTKYVQGPTYIESVNNVVYNARVWGAMQVMRNSSYSGSQPQYLAIVGEYHKAGPDTSTSTSYIFAAQSQSQAANNEYVEDSSRLFFSGNLTPKRTSQSQDQWDVCSSSTCNTNARYNSWPFTSSGVSTVEAAANYANLITTDNGMNGNIPRVGAYPRDTHDTKAIKDIASGSAFYGTDGEYIASPPALQKYSSGNTPSDADRDGMPDDWETARGLNQNDASDAHMDRNSDGYYNIEEYINSFFVPNASEPSTLSPPAEFMLE